MEQNKPLVSIVTVTYNAEKVLERTLESIKAQTYTNFEYIIVDGASDDGTLAIAKKHGTTIDKLISEPDKGLYDAMNKGLTLATGKYVWFMNAGDEIYAPDTLQQIAANCNSQNADIIYGETMITAEDGSEIGLRRLKAPKQLTKRSFLKGMLISHQAVLVNRNIATKYDLKYKYSADYNWLLQSIFNSKNNCNSELILAKFLDGGQTKQTIVPGLKERFKIMVLHYGIIRTVLNHIPIAFKFFSFLFKNKRF